MTLEEKHLLRSLVKILSQLSEQIESVNQNREAAKAPQQPDPLRPPGVEVRLPEEITEYYHSEQHDRPAKGFWKRITFWLELLGVVIAFALAVFTLLTLREIQKQTPAVIDSGKAATKAAKAATDAVGQARDNFRQDQRPYIALPENTSSGRFGVHEGRVRVLLPIQNYGRSPAIDAVSFGKVAIGREQIQRINFNAATTQDLGIVPPGVFPPISAFSEVLTSPDDVKQPMVIYGRIDYTDIFAAPKPKYSLFFCQAANVEITVSPSYALQACKGRNYIK